MKIFGFTSKKEVESIERNARQEGHASGRSEGRRLGEQAVLERQSTEIANLAKGSQIKFAVPYFDVFDPRFSDFGVPVSVHGHMVYGIDDQDRFCSINKSGSYSDGVFEAKLKSQLTKYIKAIVTNAPLDYQIQVLQLERKILEISDIIQRRVTPQIEQNFGINVRSLDISAIYIDKDSKGYKELKAVTTDLEGDELKLRSNLKMDSLQRQHEMTLGGQEELQRMQFEHQRETMRIQREELQRASRLQTETNFLSAHQANLNASVGMAQAQNRMFAPQMPGMPGMPPLPGTVPQVQYMVGVNGQQMGPFNWEQLQQLVQQGQLTHQTYVWKQGMAQWQFAGEVQELTPLFRTSF